jgi:hypothetical protein
MRLHVVSKAAKPSTLRHMYPPLTLQLALLALATTLHVDALAASGNKQAWLVVWYHQWAAGRRQGLAGALISISPLPATVAVITWAGVAGK